MISDNDRANAIFYTRSGVEESKRRQFGAQRRAEIRKMYSEQYANASKSDRLSALTTGLAGSGDDAEEQVNAAWDSLMATGDVAEILSAVDGANYANIDAGVRNALVAKAAASGNQLLKGWSKDGGGRNLSSYIGDTSSGLRQYLSGQAGDHAFDTADKDTLRFLADNNGRIAMSDNMIKNIITTSANASQSATEAAKKLITGDSGRGDTTRAPQIGAMVNAGDLTKMSGAIANELGAANLRVAIDSINQPGNEAMRSKVDNDVRRSLGIIDGASGGSNSGGGPTVVVNNGNGVGTNGNGGNANGRRNASAGTIYITDRYGNDTDTHNVPPRPPVAPPRA